MGECICHVRFLRKEESVGEERAGGEVRGNKITCSDGGGALVLQFYDQLPCIESPRIICTIFPHFILIQGGAIPPDLNNCGEILEDGYPKDLDVPIRWVVV